MSVESTCRVSITGVDGAGKDTVSLGVLRLLSVSGLHVAKLGRPSYELSPGVLEPKPLYPHSLQAVDRLHQLADRVPSRIGVCAVNACNVMLQTRVIEDRLLARPNPLDVIISSRDPRIDPAVYSTFYLPRLSQAIQTGDRVRAYQRLTGVERDLVVHLRVPPEQAMARIEDRIERERRAEAAGGGPVRPKWPHMHERADNLAALASVYDEAIAHIRDTTGAQVVSIDTGLMPEQEVIDVAHTAICGVLESRYQNG